MKRVFIIPILALTACTPTPPSPPPQVQTPPDPLPPSIKVNGYDFFINGDTVSISNHQWYLAQLGKYPFTTGGDLACSNDSVEFYPNGLHDDDVGLPLNQNAHNKYKQAGFIPNVPNAIKPQADLKNAIFLGLSLCEFNRNNPYSNPPDNKK